jgi:nitrate/nitrite transporter NarK
MTAGNRGWRHYLPLMVLICAGELVFSLPFHIPRFFRATMLEVYGLSPTQLGDMFALYGIAAMLSYLPGGLVADRFDARNMLCLSLVATALAGLGMAFFHEAWLLYLLFPLWGITTILLFWAPLIKLTRSWGGGSEQGRAFGLLEAGRGLIAAAVAAVAVWLFATALGGDAQPADPAARDSGFRAVVAFYALVTLLIAVAVRLLIPAQPPAPEAHGGGWSAAHLKLVLGNGSVWLQALVIICAYCGYKGLDNYAIYAVDVLGMSELESAGFMSSTAFLRPVAALAAGLLADRIGARRLVPALFAVLLLAYPMLGLITPSASLRGLVLGNLAATFIALYALRGIYFALIAESRIPLQATGTAVGVISVAGFTPDIFF